MPFRDSPMSLFEPGSAATKRAPVAQPGRTLYGAVSACSTTAFDLPQSQAPSSIERWYVLILTLFHLRHQYCRSLRRVDRARADPPGIEVDRRRRGIAHRRSARHFLRDVRHSDFLARRPLQSAQYPGGLPDHLVGVHGAVRIVAKLLAISAWDASASGSGEAGGTPPPPPSCRIAFHPTGGPWR